MSKPDFRRALLPATVAALIGASTPVFAEEAPAINFSGLVEVEASKSDDRSDLTLATVELGAEAQLDDWVSANLLLLFEEGEGEDENTREVDEAFLTLGNEDQLPYSVSLGRLYVPFGGFTSNMVSDPLTLEIGETRETALLVDYSSDSLSASAFLFQGDTRENGNEEIDQFGFSLSYAQEQTGTTPGYNISASWINNLADSDTLQDAIGDADNLADKTAAYDLQLVVEHYNMILVGEYLSASEHFDSADLDYNGRGAKPRAWNLELGYGFNLFNQEAIAAIGWQGTAEAVALELPERRYLASVSVELLENTSLALEWAHDEDYSVSKGGSGDDNDTATLQLAVEF